MYAPYVFETETIGSLLFNLQVTEILKRFFVKSFGVAKRILKQENFIYFKEENKTHFKILMLKPHFNFF